MSFEEAEEEPNKPYNQIDSLKMFKWKREKEQHAASKSGLPEEDQLAVPKTGTLPVVGSQFCTPYHTLVFTVQRKKRNKTCSGADLVISDSDGQLIARVDGRECSLRDKRVVRNASGEPLVTLRRKLVSINHKWEAFRGEKTDPARMLFSARTSSVLQLKTSVNVYMPYNTEEEQWNFKVKGDYLERSSVFYYGARTIAELSRKRSENKELLEKDIFLVKVHPGVDYLFIISLVVVLDEIS